MSCLSWIYNVLIIIYYCIFIDLSFFGICLILKDLKKKIFEYNTLFIKALSCFCDNCHLLSLFCFITVCILVDFIANNMDPDQTAPLGVVWSGLIMFASGWNQHVTFSGQNIKSRIRVKSEKRIFCTPDTDIWDLTLDRKSYLTHVILPRLSHEACTLVVLELTHMVVKLRHCDVNHRIMSHLSVSGNFW